MKLEFDPIYRAYYDDISTGDWLRRAMVFGRYLELNMKENLTELEEQELIILAEGTEEEYRKFLKENGKK